ncbi:MAG: diguanylate cyclase, partial [Chromatiales bacterium]
MLERVRKSLPTVLIVLLIGMVAVLILWVSKRQQQAFELKQDQIMAQSVAGASRQIGFLIDSLLLSVGSLVSENEPWLERLARDPDDTAAYLRIHDHLARQLPGYVAFAIADRQGQILYDDFGESIGPLCRADLKSFAGGLGLLKVYLHPGPSEPHIDLMLPWQGESEGGVFMATFTPDRIISLLSDTEVRGHSLILLRDHPRGTLIEATADGTRHALNRDYFLNEGEVAALRHLTSVPHTAWMIAALPDLEVIAERRDELRGVALLTGSAFIVVGLLSIVLLLHEERRRSRAERGLQSANSLLEQRVDERTRELLSANEDLQHEMREHQLAERERIKLSSAIEQTEDMVFITDREGVIEYVNPSVLKVTGFTAGELIGERPSLLKSGMHEPDYYQNMWSTILSGESFRDVLINRTKDGALFYEEKTITPVRDAQGVITHFVATGKDISERMRTQERLQYLAHHDVLTGLPNRALLQDRLQHAFHQAKREGTMIALLFIDLDRFKTVNDSLGHGAGDVLLKELAGRLTHLLRESDTVARVGGDEFTVVVEGLYDLDRLGTIVEKLREELRRPVTVEHKDLVISGSIGITVYPNDGRDIETLMKNADTAMYRAKESGGNAARYFTPDMTVRVMERLELESSLYHALEQDEFYLEYQPRVEISSGRICGMEALLRWRHPGRGLVPPARFVPLLEETGLILQVGNWVLREACGFVRELNDEELGPLRVSVNLSPRQFRMARIEDPVVTVLDDLGLDGDCLELEIT